MVWKNNDGCKEACQITKKTRHRAWGVIECGTTMSEANSGATYHYIYKTCRRGVR